MLTSPGFPLPPPGLAGRETLTVECLDPGGTTGRVRGYIPRRNVTELTAPLWAGVEIEYEEIAGDDNAQSIEIDDILSSHYGPVVVESFHLRQFNRDPHLLDPVRIESRIDYMIYLINSARFPDDPGRNPDHHVRAGYQRLIKFSQAPSEAKQVGSDERLRDAGLYIPGHRHATDAARHLFLFIRKCKANPALARSAWPWLAHMD